MATVTVPRPNLQRALEHRLESALRGDASICLVTGDAGSGKSRLVRQFAKHALQQHDDLIVAYAVCNAITGVADAFMPFREILQQLLGDVDEAFAEGNVDVSNVSRVQRFIRKSARTLVENGPDLVDVFVPGGALIARLGGRFAQRWAWFDKLKQQIDSRPPDHAIATVGQENIFEQYTNVIEAMAAHTPLLLIIDDLHWADRASLGLLFQLARRLVNNRILIVAASRFTSDSPNDRELQELFNELRRYFGEITIDLSAQPKDEFVNDYLAALGIAHDERSAQALVKYTDGNPLLVAEVLTQHSGGDDLGRLLHDAHAQEFSGRLAAVLERAFQVLDEVDMRVLAVASVQGFEFWAELVADICRLELLDVLHRLGGALQNQRGIVVDTGPLDLPDGSVSRFQFRHDLLREFAYRSVPEAERRLLHRHVADAIRQRTDGLDDEYCLPLADHYEKARDWRRAQHYRILAARRTEKACAPKEAAGHYAAAIALGERQVGEPEASRFNLALQLASQLALAGDFQQAEAAARDALDTAQQPDDASTAWLAIGRIARRSRQHADALNALEQADACLRTDDADGSARQLQIDILLERALIHYLQRDVESLLKSNELIAGLIDTHGAPHQRVAYFSSRSRQALSGSGFAPSLDALEFARNAVDSEQPASPNTLFGFAFATLWNEQFDDAIELLREAETGATRHGDSTTRLQALVYLSVAYRRKGNTDAVKQLTENIAVVLGQTSMPEYPAVLQAQEAWLAYRADETGAAESLAQSALQYWCDSGSSYPFCWLASWIVFALADVDSQEVLNAANHMLSEGQAWQRDEVSGALKTFADAGGTPRHHRAAVKAATHAGYL